MRELLKYILNSKAVVSAGINLPFAILHVQRAAKCTLLFKTVMIKALFLAICISQIQSACNVGYLLSYFAERKLIVYLLCVR